MGEQKKLQEWVMPSDRIERACSDMIAEELRERGMLIGGDGIRITQKPIRDGKIFSLIKSGKLEHTNMHIVAQLICVWIVSGYHFTKPEEKVNNLIVGEYRTIPPFVRLGRCTDKA